jgi:hypothetical protein
MIRIAVAVVTRIVYQLDRDVHVHYAPIMARSTPTHTIATTASGTSDEEAPPIVTQDHQAELPSAASGARWGRSFHSLGEMARPLTLPDIEAELHFLSTSAGGKKRPACSGYRPDHDFGGPTLSGAHHEFVGEDAVSPGDSIRSLLWLLDPASQVGRLYPGFEFVVQEGQQVVARGVIVHVLNQALYRRA